jgi:hypothetical protein
MLLVTADAIQCFGNYHIDLAKAQVAKKLLITGPQMVRARDRHVGVDSKFAPPLTFDQSATDANLVLDGRLTL